MWQNLCFNGKYYEEAGGISLGSSLVPLVAKLYIKHSEQNNTKYCSTKAEIRRLMLILNSIQQNITFIMHKREQLMLSLNVLLSKTLNGQLDHVIYRKPTNMDLNPHGISDHDSSHKQAIPSILICWTKTISDSRQSRWWNTTLKENRAAKHNGDPSYPSHKQKLQIQRSKLFGMDIITYVQLT